MINIINASKIIKKIMKITPLQYNNDLSIKYNNKIFLKREDLTPVKSYKIRGAYNKIYSLSRMWFLKMFMKGILRCLGIRI